MKVGVRPWQGYDRAVNHSLSYVGWYTLMGVTPAIAFPLVFASAGETALAIVILHLASAPILFPGAFLVNFVGLRKWPARTWRRYPGRAKGAAILSVISVWAGLIVCELARVRPPAFVVEVLGLTGAYALHYCGLTVVLSTWALVIVWIAPPER